MSQAQRFVGLLRGVNVGTSVRVPMGELKSLLTSLGLREVVTYLNSGNVLWESENTCGELTNLIGTPLAQKFGQEIPLLIKTAAEITAICDSIPDTWGSDDTQQTYVAYLFPEADRPGLLDELPVKRQFATLLQVPGAVMWNIKRENYHRSQITKIVGHPAYALMTTRNLNTAKRLADLCRAPR